VRAIERDARAERTAPGMDHQDHPADAQSFQRFIDHSTLDIGRRIVAPRARAPAVPGTIDQDHPTVFGKPVAKPVAASFAD